MPLLDKSTYLFLISVSALVLLPELQTLADAHSMVPKRILVKRAIPAAVEVRSKRKHSASTTPTVISSPAVQTSPKKASLQTHAAQVPQQKNPFLVVIEGEMVFGGLHTASTVSKATYQTSTTSWTCAKAVCKEEQANKTMSDWLHAAVKRSLQVMDIKQDMRFKHGITSCQACSADSAATMEFAIVLNPTDATQVDLQHVKQQIVSWLDEDLCDATGMDILCAEVGLAELRLLDAWSSNNMAHPAYGHLGAPTPVPVSRASADAHVA